MSASRVFQVTVKHGKKKHKGVELDMEGLTLEGLQAIVFSLTQVLPERQKIIVKGKQIENDNDLESFIKNKSILVIMGSAEESITTSNKSKSKFMEDLTDSDLQNVIAILPPGLYNLGNTCYLNSTLQCMKGIEELKDSLILNKNESNGISKELGNLFKSMTETSDAVNPSDFVQEFRNRFPEFATRNEQGVWEQQDADECLTKLLTNIENENNNSLINNLFAGEFEYEMKCLENENEIVGPMYEKFLKLRCFIDTETRHIAYGIQKSMSEELTKYSNLLKRNAQWQKTQKISKLPKYLTVSMVRFFWKQSKQKNAKILKSVQFDIKFDISTFCNKKLKDKIEKFRKLKMEIENQLREKKQMQGISLNKNENENENDNNNSNDKNESENNGNNENLEEEKKAKDEMEIDNEDENEYESGFYELVGLITHKGLSANSGHYIGYFKDSKRGWLKFDDDVVTEVKEDDIKKLYGGGQWQMGYVCFYRKSPALLPK